MEFLRLCWYVIRRRWVVIMLCIAVCLTGATLFNNAQPATYTASSEMFLRAPDMKTSASAYQGDLFTRQRAQSYMNLFSSDDLAKSVIDKLKLSMTPSELESKVSAENIKDTVIIVVSVTDSDAQQAANIANGYTSVFGNYVAEMENLADDPTVKAKPLVTVVKTASADTAVQGGYSATVVYGAALVIALLLAAVIIYLLERFDTRIRTRRQIETLASAPVLATFGSEIDDADMRGGWGAEDVDLAESARRLLVAVRSRLEMMSLSRPDDERSLVAVFGGSDGSDASQVATALATASAAAGNATCVIRTTEPLAGVHAGGGEDREARDAGMVSSHAAHVDVQAIENPEEVTISFGDAQMQESRERIKELGKEMDLAVIDAPAATEAAACDISIQAAGSAVIVVSPGATTKVALADAVAKADTLGRPVLGVVVTRARETPTLSGVYR